jgi:hypothetical protein
MRPSLQQLLDIPCSFRFRRDCSENCWVSCSCVFLSETLEDVKHKDRVDLMAIECWLRKLSFAANTSPDHGPLDPSMI